MDWVSGWLVALLPFGLASPEQASWSSALQALDQLRASAFATGDAVALDKIYVSGSAVAEADRALLSAYRSRGVQVQGMRMTVLSCEVVAADWTRVELDVVDRLDRARARWLDGTERLLPRDEPSRNRVILEFTAAGWRIAAIHPH